MLDFLVTDPLLKRVRRMGKIQDKLKENTSRRREILIESEKLTKEYEQLKVECKSLKKTGKLPDGVSS